MRQLHKRYATTLAVQILTHAIWHCLYGSECIKRTPDQADKIKSANLPGAKMSAYFRIVIGYLVCLLGCYWLDKHIPLVARPQYESILVGLIAGSTAAIMQAFFEYKFREQK